MGFPRTAKRLKVLLIIEQCNPEGVSVPLVGYRFYNSISQLSDTTLVTHARNKASLEKIHPDRDIVYLFESELSRRYYNLAALLSCIKGKIIWPLRLMLTYPIYAEFNHSVYTHFCSAIEREQYDIVHAITPMMPRYPVKVVKACKTTPFVMGPVNGGIPFPRGFRALARREFSGLNFLRWVGRSLIPGYRETYQQADKILVGSDYTAGLIQDLFEISRERLELLSENGLTPAFFSAGLRRSHPHSHAYSTERPLSLLFVGRLVPYKSADILLEAVSQLNASLRDRVRLTIVGSGPERSELQRQTDSLKLQDAVRFTGWVSHAETIDFYRQADIFCFPSLREFGGAVVLEAMAHGLPCIVVNHGGVGEYVTEKTGFRIEPISRAFIVRQITEKIEQLVDNPVLHEQMSYCAVERAREFTWTAKAKRIVALYQVQVQQLEKTPVSVG